MALPVGKVFREELRASRPREPLRERSRPWARHGGILWHLALGCFAVYGLSVLIAWLIWTVGRLTTPRAAFAVLACGGAVLCLAAVLREVYRRYPEAERPPAGSRRVGLLRPKLNVLLQQCREVDWMAGSHHNLVWVGAPVRLHGRRDRLEAAHPGRVRGVQTEVRRRGGRWPAALGPSI